MNGFFDTILAQVDAGLREMQQESSPVCRCEGCIKVLQAAITALKRELLLNPFADKEEEIVYFRHQAPAIYSRLFYYMQLLTIERHRLFLTRDNFRVLLQEKVQGIEEFYVQHMEILQYSCRKSLKWDLCLYTRQGEGEWWAEEEGLYIDEDFTIGSYWSAKTQANADLRLWLENELKELDEPVDGKGKGATGGLAWTDKLVDLVELGYSLHEAGCFNNGEATLKQVMELLEKSFGVKVGKYHIMFEEIGRRKTGRTKFHDRLLKKLIEKLDSMV
jgi:hypothetical protein